MSDRVELVVADAAPGAVYPWFTAALIPRAIAWVSSRSPDGIANLAPHSFTTVAGIDPPTLCFVSVGHKDTLANVRATGEFVLNIGSRELLTAMNDTATPFPPDEDEFSAAGLDTEPSVIVAPPRVAAAPVVFECRVSGEHEIGECVMVFGEVLQLAARRDVLADDGLPDALVLDPLARLGRAEWGLLGEVIALNRIRYPDWRAGRRSRDG